MELNVEANGLIIVYFNAFNFNYYDDLLEIIELNYFLNIVNVNVIIKHSSRSPIIFMYTYFPFTEYHCFGKPPVIINQYIEGKWIRDGYFFPDKDRNMFLCPLVVATWEDKPYVRMATDDVTGTYKIVPKGIEGRMYEYMSFKLNFTMKFLWLKPWQQVLASAINDSFFEEVSVYV